MRESDLLYGSWRMRGTPLNKMLHCGSYYNDWVAHALRYLPEKILAQVVDKLAIFSTAQRDGCRIARAICEEREIILLSERILPKKTAKEYHPEVRYFIFAVIHEVAHAFKNHCSLLYDHLSEEEDRAQEKEAEELALSWFNEHVRKRNILCLHPLTYEEIEEAKQKNQRLMNELYEGVS
jgi:hypothetical protein